MFVPRPWEDIRSSVQKDLARPLRFPSVKFGSDGFLPQYGSFLQYCKNPQFKSEKDKFQVMLNVHQFKHNEINIKVVENCIVIHGKHEEKTDEHGFIEREFTRRYLLPEDIDPDTVTASLSVNGVLTVEAPEKVIRAPPSNEDRVKTEVKPRYTRDLIWKAIESSFNFPMSRGPFTNKC